MSRFEETFEKQGEVTPTDNGYKFNWNSQGSATWNKPSTGEPQELSFEDNIYGELETDGATYADGYLTHNKSGEVNGQQFSGSGTIEGTVQKNADGVSAEISGQSSGVRADGSKYERSGSVQFSKNVDPDTGEITISSNSSFSRAVTPSDQTSSDVTKPPVDTTSSGESQLPSDASGGDPVPCQQPSSDGAESPPSTVPHDANYHHYFNASAKPADLDGDGVADDKQLNAAYGASASWIDSSGQSHQFQTNAMLQAAKSVEDTNSDGIPDSTTYSVTRQRLSSLDDATYQRSGEAKLVVQDTDANGTPDTFSFARSRSRHEV